MISFKFLNDISIVDCQITLNFFYNNAKEKKNYNPFLSDFRKKKKAIKILNVNFIFFKSSRFLSFCFILFFIMKEKNLVKKIYRKKEKKIIYKKNQDFKKMEKQCIFFSFIQKI